MSDFRYLTAVLLSAIIALTLLALPVVWVDPYGLFPGAWRLGNSIPRFAEQFGDNRIIRAALVLRQPKTVLIGSSRVFKGYDASRLDGTTLAPAYNASFYGHGLKNRLQTLRAAVSLDRSLRNAIIEIFPVDVMHAPNFWDTPLNIFPGAMGYLSLLWSPRSLNDAALILGSLVGLRPYDASSELVHTMSDQTTLRIMPTAAKVSYRIFPPEARIDPAWFESVLTMQAVCMEHKVNCKFVIAPVSARALYGYYFFRGEEAIAELKRKMSTLNAEVYDFLWLNKITAETLGSRLSYWRDPLHHAVEVGDYVLDNISGNFKLTPEAWERFYVRSNSQNVEAGLGDLRSQVAAWASANPEVERTYTAIGQDMAEPVKSSAVSSESKKTIIRVNNKSWKASTDGGGQMVWSGLSPLASLVFAMGIATDASKKLPVEHVAAVCGEAVLGWARPNFEIEREWTGFYFGYPSPKPGQCKDVRYYSLFSDGSARELSRPH
jgi:hypothetical protein